MMYRLIGPKKLFAMEFSKNANILTKVPKKENKKTIRFECFRYAQPQTLWLLIRSGVRLRTLTTLNLTLISNPKPLGLGHGHGTLLNDV